MHQDIYQKKLISLYICATRECIGPKANWEYGEKKQHSGEICSTFRKKKDTPGKKERKRTAKP